MARVRSGALVVLFALVIAGCSSTSSSRPPSPPTSSRTATAASCAWYTPTALPQGQLVILTAEGSTCGAAAPVVEFAAERLRAVWYSSGLDFGAEATLIAQLAKGRVVVRIFQLGNSAAVMRRAGQLADDFEAAGWRPQVPTGPQGPVPSISYSTALAAS
jgi:hypothetical protein